MQFVLELLQPVLQISAVVLLVIGYAAYTYFVRTGFADPNPFTWASLALVSLAAGQWLLAACAIATLVHMFATGLQSRERATGDWAALAYCAAVFVARFALRDLIEPFWMQALIVMGLGIAFYPTVANVIRYPYSDHPLAWFAWAASFGMSALAAHLYRGGEFFSVMQPAMLMACSAFVAFCALREEKFGRARLLKLE